MSRTSLFVAHSFADIFNMPLQSTCTQTADIKKQNTCPTNGFTAFKILWICTSVNKPITTTLGGACLTDDAHRPRKSRALEFTEGAESKCHEQYHPRAILKNCTDGLKKMQDRQTAELLPLKSRTGLQDARSLGCLCAKSLQSVRLFATPWTVARQAPLSMGFSSPLEWVAVPSSRGSSQSRDGTCVSYTSCIGRQVLYHQHHLGNPMVLDNSTQVRPGGVQQLSRRAHTSVYSLQLRLISDRLSRAALLAGDVAKACFILLAPSWRRLWIQ